MLGAFLGVGEKLRGKRLVFIWIRAARPRPGDGPDGHGAVAHPHQDLRARPSHGEAIEIEVVEEGRRIDAPERAIEREGGKRERRLEALAQHHLEDVAGGDVLLGARDLLHIGRWRHARLQLRVRGFRLEVAHMRQRLVETLDDDVQPVSGSAVGHLGTDARRRPDRRHHGHFVLHRVEDDDQRRTHEDAVRQVKQIRLGRGQMLDQPHRVVAHIAENACGHRRQRRRKRDRQLGKQRPQRLQRRLRRGGEGRRVGLRRTIHLGAGAIGPPDQVRLAADDGIAAAHGAAFDRTRAGSCSAAHGRS